MTDHQKRKLQNLGGILLLNVLVGIGAYFVAYQFNDGKINRHAVGTIFLAMALPNLFVGAVIRVFKHPFASYFLRAALLWIFIGIMLLAL